MDVKNCKSCGRLFNYMGGEKLCPACRDQLEEIFQTVKRYIEEHPGANINEVSSECEVSTNQLKQWIREERLTFSEDSPITIECEQCGAPIRSGRFCDACRGRITNTLSNAYKRTDAPKPQKKEREREKMRFLDN